MDQRVFDENRVGYLRRPREEITFTSDLTPEERGVYWVLVDLTFEHGAPVSLEDRRWPAAEANCTVPRFHKILAVLVQKKLVDIINNAVRVRRPGCRT